MEKSIYSSVILSLVVTGKMTLGEAAYLTGCSFTEYIGFLRENQIAWPTNLKDGHSEHQKSLPHLFSFIDSIVEEDLEDEEVHE